MEFEKRALSLVEKALKYFCIVAIAQALATVAVIIALFVYQSQYDYVNETVLVETDGDGHANYIGGNGGINNGKGKSGETEQDKEVQRESQVEEGT